MDKHGLFFWLGKGRNWTCREIPFSLSRNVIRNDIITVKLFRVPRENEKDFSTLPPFIDDRHEFAHPSPPPPKEKSGNPAAEDPTKRTMNAIDTSGYGTKVEEKKNGGGGRIIAALTYFNITDKEG